VGRVSSALIRICRPILQDSDRSRESCTAGMVLFRCGRADLTIPPVDAKVLSIFDICTVGLIVGYNWHCATTRTVKDIVGVRVISMRPERRLGRESGPMSAILVRHSERPYIKLEPVSCRI